MPTTSRKLGFLRTLSMFWALFTDRRSPTLAKVLPILGLIYGISPIDLIPDILPLLGQTDDVVVIVTLILIAVRMIPHELYREHRERVKAEVIDHS